MTIEQARNYLQSSGFSEEQINAIQDAFSMKDRWEQLEETIAEIRDNNKYDNDTATELCKFLLNYMDVLEKEITK